MSFDEIKSILNELSAINIAMSMLSPSFPYPNSLPNTHHFTTASSEFNRLTTNSIITQQENHPHLLSWVVYCSLFRTLKEYLQACLDADTSNLIGDESSQEWLNELYMDLMKVVDEAKKLNGNKYPLNEEVKRKILFVEDK